MKGKQSGEGMVEEKIQLKATWWEDGGEDTDRDSMPATEDVELRAYFDGETFYIDGLRDGHYLSIDLRDLAKVIAAGG
ncbi:MAG: hypothetical protein ACM3Q9_00895 [Methanosarcina sp.]